jgi:hypothetical protein
MTTTRKKTSNKKLVNKTQKLANRTSANPSSPSLTLSKTIITQLENQSADDNFTLPVLHSILLITLLITAEILLYLLTSISFLLSSISYITGSISALVYEVRGYIIAPVQVAMKKSGVPRNWYDGEEVPTIWGVRRFGVLEGYDGRGDSGGTW